jgi:3-(3-hydroxy-phenyl)propionate hydroxylase
MANALTCDVVIIGAGPTGLTLANLLCRAGIGVIVVERNASTVTSPRAVSMDDESLRTMQAIGLIDEVMRNVAADYGSHYYTAHTKLFLKVEPTTREYGFPRRNAFTQPELERTLLEGARRYANAELLFEHTVESLAETDEGVVLSVRESGGRELAISARYAAGCDGARSVCRKIIGASMVGSTYPQRWLIVDLASTRERLRQTRVVCDPARPFITLPGPRGIRRYEFMLRDSETDAAATDPEFVRKLLNKSGPDADAPVVRRQVYAFHALIADRWNTPRIYLAGDAAHLSPPFAGQGMNSGLRDAFNLGWKLAKVVRGEVGPGLLATYFEERAPHAKSLIQMAVNMGRIMMPTSAFQALLVQGLFRLTRFAPRIQAYFAQMKYKPKPFYRSGFLVTQEPGTLVGRMLPQPRVETKDGCSVLLDELLGSGFRLVAYGPDAEARLREAAPFDFSLQELKPLAILPNTINRAVCGECGLEIVRDLSRDFLREIPEGTTILMLVRPDRYIAAASTAPAATMAQAVRGLVESMRPA